MVIFLNIECINPKENDTNNDNNDNPNTDKENPTNCDDGSNDNKVRISSKI